MRKLFFFIIISLLVSMNSFAAKEKAKEKEKQDDSPLSAGEIVEFVEYIRPIMKEGDRVDIARHFKDDAETDNTRFGNKKTVLNLSGLSFANDNMSLVNLNLANMKECDLTNADFSNSELIHVDFENADLTGANFSKSDLSYVSFSKATITNTNFDGTNLFKANFDEAIGVSKEELQKLKSRTNAYIELKRLPIEENL